MASNVTIPSGIRGVSEERRTPRLGKIRLGIQAPNKSGKGTHPEMSPYFVFDADTAAGAALYEQFGDRCTAIPVAFPSDMEDEFARRNLEAWGAGTLKCRGNGVEALALVDPGEYAKYRQKVAAADGERLPVPEKVWRTTARAGNDDSEPVRELIPCFGMGYDGEPACPLFAAEKCKATMHLQVIVRGFPGLGIFQIDTGSVVNIQRLDDFLAYLGNFTDGRFAMVPLVMRLEPYDMRGRKYYGLTFAVDFAAMQAQGIGALPGVSQMSVADRVLRFLPQETASPAAPQMLAAGTEGDDAPSDGGSVDVLTGEIVEGDEQPDDADDGSEAPEAPTPEQLQEASAFIGACSKAAGVGRDDVLSALNADVFAIALDLQHYRATWERGRAQEPVRRQRAAPAASTSGPSAANVKARPMLIAWAQQVLGLNQVQLLEALSLSKTEDLDGLAEEQGGWPEAAAWVEQFLGQPAGVSS